MRIQLLDQTGLLEKLDNSEDIRCHVVAFLKSFEHVTYQPAAAAVSAVCQMIFYGFELVANFFDNRQHEGKEEVVFGFKVLINGGFADFSCQGNFIHRGPGIAFGKKDLFGGLQDAFKPQASLPRFSSADGVLVFIAVHALPRFGGVNLLERGNQFNYNRFDSTHDSITPEPTIRPLKHCNISNGAKP